MRRRVPALDRVVELRIGADAIVADQQPRRDFGMRVDQAMDDRVHRIVLARDTKEDFVIRIIEREARAQGLARKRLDAADRADQGHRRCIGRHGQRPAAEPHASRGERDAEQVQRDGEQTETGECNRHEGISIAAG